MPSSASARLTEQRNPRSAGIDRRDTDDILGVFDDEDRAALEAVAAVRRELGLAIDWVVEALGQGGRLLYVGAGTSGRLGVLDASECPPTFGVSTDLVVGIIAGGDAALRRSVEEAEDHPEDGAQAMRDHDVAATDVVLGIATSGRTPYVLGALAEAHTRNARTILLSCTSPEPNLADYVALFITPLVGPEIITGSTRLKAGTATKLVLNRITTIAMIRLGKTYDNLMVDVQATNEKLRDRAQRIVMEVAGVDVATARRALAESQGNTKLAALMLMRGLSAPEARQVLEEKGPALRKALLS